MAIYHLAVKTIGRSAGRSATAAAAYRSGDEIADERTGEIHDYTRRSGVVDAFIVTPPGASAWAGDRAELWNQAEASERRKDSTVAREVVVALPAELDVAQRRELVAEFAGYLVQRHGVAVDVAIHAPGGEGDQRNEHAHLLLSTRRLGPEGFGEKTRELDDKRGPAEIRAWREAWAEAANRHLEVAGHEARIDHRSLIAQGITREPTRHLGVAATAMQRLDDRAASTREAEAREAAAAPLPADAQVTAARSNVLDLTVRLEAAREAARAERERREQAERDRLDAMSAAELRRDAAAVRPVPLGEQIAAHPQVAAATERADSLAERIGKFDAANATMAERAAQWREAHPVRARAHDSGRRWLRSKFLAAVETKTATNEGRRDVLQEQHGATSAEVRTAKLAAAEELQPEHNRRAAEAAWLDELAAGRERAEAVAARLAREAARFAATSAKLGRMMAASDARDAGYKGPSRFTASDQVWKGVDAFRRRTPTPEAREQLLANIAAPSTDEARKACDEVARMIGGAREGQQQQPGRRQGHGQSQDDQEVGLG